MEKETPDDKPEGGDGSDEGNGGDDKPEGDGS